MTRYLISNPVILTVVIQGPRREQDWGNWGLSPPPPPPPHLGNLVRTFDFLYERSHSRKRNKNVISSNFLMHFQPFRRPAQMSQISGRACHWPPSWQLLTCPLSVQPHFRMCSAAPVRHREVKVTQLTWSFQSLQSGTPSSRSFTSRLKDTKM